MALFEYVVLTFFLNVGLKQAITKTFDKTGYKKKHPCV